jgi:hypothetical protein
LKTWGGKSEFQFNGSVQEGTWIRWNDNAKPDGFSKEELVKPEQYQSSLATFAGQELALGNYRNPAPRTLEAWLKEQKWGGGLARHLGTILVEEGYANQAAQRGRISFKPINT